MQQASQTASWVWLASFSEPHIFPANFARVDDILSYPSEPPGPPAGSGSPIR